MGGGWGQLRCLAWVLSWEGPTGVARRECQGVGCWTRILHGTLPSLQLARGMWALGAEIETRQGPPVHPLLVILLPGCSSKAGQGPDTQPYRSSLDFFPSIARPDSSGLAADSWWSGSGQVDCRHDAPSASGAAPCDSCGGCTLASGGPTEHGPADSGSWQSAAQASGDSGPVCGGRTCLGLGWLEAWGSRGGRSGASGLGFQRS